MYTDFETGMGRLWAQIQKTIRKFVLKQKNCQYLSLPNDTKFLLAFPYKQTVTL